MLDYTAGNRFKRTTAAFILTSLLVLWVSIMAASVTSSIVPISIIGIWFTLAAATGLTKKMYETERLSNLSTRSIEEIENLISIQLMLGDMYRADEASKILKEKTENLSVRE